ncbi:DUF6701 domain-containing protein [Vibrio renipiscarius]|uniref:DUF6701 domain-containing protein n=1 Tax=Vibrio renipiscarius TaxID=1461322 RepID=UPI00069C96F4|nr:DUF6701 domain-containing protein [Vibrio renipiscarius]
MTKYIRIFSILLISLLYFQPNQSLASQCLIAGTSVNAYDGFCFTFKIDSDGTNRVRLEKSKYYPLWTDDIDYKRYSPAVYEDEYISERKERTFQVKFSANSKSRGQDIVGRIVYYVDGLLMKEIDGFNLSKVTGVSKRSPHLKLNLIGNEFHNSNDYCISSGSCFRDNLELCRYFPQPAQSWKKDSKVTFGNPTPSSGQYPFFIGGWSEYYLDEHLNTDTGMLDIDFGSISYIDGKNDKSCESGQCNASADRIEKPIYLQPTFGSVELVLGTWNFEEVCPKNNSGKYCHSYKKNNGHGKETVYVTIKSDLGSLSVSGNTSTNVVVDFTSQPGVYGRVIGDYSMDQYVRSVFNNPGVYTFKSIYGGKNSQLEIGRNVTWKVKDAIVFSTSVELINPSLTDDFIIYAPEADIYFQGVNGDYNGLILADSLTIENNMTIFGSVTTNKLSMKTKNVRIVGQSQCFTLPPEPDVSRIVIKPFNYHLTCESSPENTVEVHVYDSDGQYVPGKTPTLKETSGNNLEIKFLSESGGIAKYKVTKKDMSSLGAYELTASLPVSSGGPLTANETIKYVPYKFEVADQNIVAGQHNKVDIAVKACSSDSNGQSQLITLGYTGSPQASFSYLSPVTPPDASDLKFSAHLDDTNRSADFTFMESGQITVVVEDKDFECIDTDDVHCPVEGGALKGEFSVNSRPYKLAICNVVETAKPSNKNPATTSVNRGFMASGREFSVTYQPIVHPDSKGSTSNECLFPLTENYGLDNGPLDLSYHVAYPKPSTTGSVTPNTPPNFSPEDSTLTLTHTWDEVGTIVFKSDATYLNMKLDRDAQRIGRFYPSYFAISESTWTAPDNQNDVTYLSQNFDDTKIMVGAYAFDSVVPVKNYHLFDESLKAKFVLRKTGSAINNPMNLETELGGWGAESTYSYWRLSDKNASVSRQQTVSGSTITSQENGPFNLEMITDPQSTKTDFGLRISGHDPVSFDEDETVLEQAFPYQPKLKYGRMALGSSGGPSGSHLNVPLRVEYWNGSHFVKNTDDDRSQLSSLDDYVCRQTVWDEGAESNSKLSGASQLPMPHVEKGEFTGLQVLADSGNHTLREQVRFWLRMDDVNENGHRSPQTRLDDVVCGGYGLAQPWLQYNWRNEGDEDPSTVATFGIYRGHDKIIFRGEPGLTGL